MGLLKAVLLSPPSESLSGCGFGASAGPSALLAGRQDSTGGTDTSRKRPIPEINRAVQNRRYA